MKQINLWSVALLSLFVVFQNGHAEHELDQDTKATKSGGVVVRVDNETNRVKVLKVTKVPAEIKSGAINKLKYKEQQAKMDEILDRVEADETTEVLADYVISDADLAKMAGGELEEGDSTASCFFRGGWGYRGYYGYGYRGGCGYGYRGCGYGGWYRPVYNWGWRIRRSYAWGGYGCGWGW